MDKQISRTAILPLVDLAERTDVPYCKDIAKVLVTLNGEKVASSGKSYLAESRYMGSHQRIVSYPQIVELGSGFTPHAYHSKQSRNGNQRYVEVDFPSQSKLKRKVLSLCSLVLPEEEQRFIEGDVFDQITQESIRDSVKISSPVGFFAEGFMQYTNPEQRQSLAYFLMPLLSETGGEFWFEDSLTFHPEFKDNPKLRSLSERMQRISGNKQLTNYLTQQELESEFFDLGFDVKRIPAYSKLTSRDLDEEGKALISNFKNWVLTPRGKK